MSRFIYTFWRPCIYFLTSFSFSHFFHLSVLLSFAMLTNSLYVISLSFSYPYLLILPCWRYPSSCILSHSYLELSFLTFRSEKFNNFWRFVNIFLPLSLSLCEHCVWSLFSLPSSSTQMNTVEKKNKNFKFINKWNS